MRAGNQPAFGTGLPEHVRALLRGRGRVHVIVGRQGGHIRLDGEGPHRAVDGASVNGEEFREFKRDIHDRVDKGLPLVWCVVLGVIPDKSAPQAAGGHMRLIIGYNDRESSIVFSDTWGAKFEFQTMKKDDAWTMTYGLYTLEPSRRQTRK